MAEACTYSKSICSFNFRESSIQKESCVQFELGDCSGDYEDSVKCPCEEYSGRKDGCGSLLST